MKYSICTSHFFFLFFKLSSAVLTLHCILLVSHSLETSFFLSFFEILSFLSFCSFSPLLFCLTYSKCHLCFCFGQWLFYNPIWGQPICQLHSCLLGEKYRKGRKNILNAVNLWHAQQTSVITRLSKINMFTSVCEKC